MSKSIELQDLRIGLWLEGTGIIRDVISLVEDTKEYLEDYEIKIKDMHADSTGIYREFTAPIEYYKLWAPETDELCWFWDGEQTYPTLRRFKVMDRLRYTTELLFTYTYCEPFIGDLSTRQRKHYGIY